MNPLQHCRKRVAVLLLVAVVGVSLLAMPAVGQGTAATGPPSSPQEWVQTFYMIAQWQSSRILGAYDILEQTNQAALAKARELSFSLVLNFPDVSAFRARIRSLADSVGNASDPTAAKKALKELEAGRKDIDGQLQAAAAGVVESLKGAGVTLKERIKEQMKPYVAQAQERNKQIIAEERTRILETDEIAQALVKRLRELDKLNEDIEYREVEGQLRSYMQTRLQLFGEGLKQQAQAQLKAKAEELAKPDLERLQAIGALFKEQKNRLEAHAAASKAEWPQVWKQVVQIRKTLILRDIDAKIAQAKGKIEESAKGLSLEQRDQQGFTALLAAIDQARQDLEPALEAALTATDEKGVKEALSTFSQRWAEATVRKIATTALPKLQASHDWATKTLEQLRARTPQTPQVQAAVAGLSTWIQDIQRAQQLFTSAEPVPSLQQVQEALEKTKQDAAEVKKLMEALKAEAKP